MDISVIVPTFNRARLIAETLDAILTQTLPPREVIVVDDGSTDDTPQVLADYGERITAVRITNSGVQVARNTGIARAQCNWVALCDSDDVWLPNHLAAQARLITAEPAITLSFSNFRTFREGSVEDCTKFDEAPPGFWEALPRRVRPEGWVFDGSIAEATFHFHPLFPSAMLLSKPLLQAAGGFNPQIPRRVEDGEFTLRCLYRAKVGAIPEPLVLIRRHESNASRDLAPRLADEVTALRYIKANHAEAVPYHATIDNEIRQRTIMAIDAAFAAADHALARRMLRELPWHERSLKLHVKRLVASLPDSIGVPLNGLLQALAGKRPTSDTLVR